MQGGLVLDLGQERRMLLAVPAAQRPGVWPQEFARGVGVWRVPGNGIELMVAHDRTRAAGLHHAALVRPPVDEVADKEGLAVGVPVRSVPVAVAQPGQQAVELARLAVDVADDVVVHVHPSFVIVNGTMKLSYTAY